jgi:hypothetical protein
MNQLTEWYLADQKLRELKKHELALRKAVFGAFFPEPNEGTNRCDIEGGELVATYPFNYSLDKDPDAIAAGLEHVTASKREKLIIHKPSFVKSVFNGLSKKSRTAFTAECLTVKPGTPTLVIVPRSES